MMRSLLTAVVVACLPVVLPRPAHSRTLCTMLTDALSGKIRSPAKVSYVRRIIRSAAMDRGAGADASVQPGLVIIMPLWPALRDRSGGSDAAAT
jgi:hypothetical protein